MKPRERPQRKKRDCGNCLGISKLHGWLDVHESARKEKKERREKTRRVMIWNEKKCISRMVSEMILSLKTRAYII